MLKITLGVFLLTLLWHHSESGLAPSWGSCGCYWGAWDAWSQCSASCGGGYKYRTRQVWLYDDRPGCDTFEDCASSDMGEEYDYACNTICYHGTFYNRRCHCSTGWYGTCCSNQIKCGNPGGISHGFVDGSSFVYDSIVVYHCNQYYNLTGGTRTQRCQSNSIWSGKKPRCAFVNSCHSNPCLNNGTCINGFDVYRCACSKSFTGVNCEIDIQPPEMNNCPYNMTQFSAEPVTYINWTSPTFNDPVGKPIRISTNYPQNSYSFPWGDFKVQYVALKPSNGMRTSCIFTIKIRPHPCKPLSIPQNGAKVCNGWKQDYGEFCLAFCGHTYSLDIRYSHHQWYVCSTSGKWTPNALPNCTGISLTSKTDDDRFRYNNCSSSDQIQKMQETFLAMFQTSNYNDFCSKFQDQCRRDNVDVVC